LFDHVFYLTRTFAYYMHRAKWYLWEGGLGPWEETKINYPPENSTQEFNTEQ
jgi:hypothetical protein